MRKSQSSVEVGKNDRRGIDGAARKRTKEGAVRVIIVGRKEVVVESTDTGEVKERTARRVKTRVGVGRMKVEAGKKGFERRVTVNEGSEEKGTGFN